MESFIGFNHCVLFALFRAPTQSPSCPHVILLCNSSSVIIGLLPIIITYSNLDPLRSRCQNKMRGMGDVLEEMSVKGKKQEKAERAFRPQDRCDICEKRGRRHQTARTRPIGVQFLERLNQPVSGSIPDLSRCCYPHQGQRLARSSPGDVRPHILAVAYLKVGQLGCQFTCSPLQIPLKLWSLLVRALILSRWTLPHDLT